VKISIVNFVIVTPQTASAAVMIAVK